MCWSFMRYAITVSLIAISLFMVIGIEAQTI